LPVHYVEKAPFVKQGKFTEGGGGEKPRKFCQRHRENQLGKGGIEDQVVRKERKKGEREALLSNLLLKKKQKEKKAENVLHGRGEKKSLDGGKKSS